MAKEWVDHSLDLARKAKNNLEAAVKAQIKVKQKLKDTLAQLSEVEKAHKNAESALQSYKTQVANALEAQEKPQNRLALTVVELKQTQQQLEAKEQEKAEAEQAAYDISMKKTAESLTAQLRDVAYALCLEVYGHNLDAAGVLTESELQAPNSVYYPSALQLAPTSPKLLANSSSVPPPSTITPDPNPSSAFVKGKGKSEGLPPTTDVVTVENKEDVVEATQSKKK